MECVQGDDSSTYCLKSRKLCPKQRIWAYQSSTEEWDVSQTRAADMRKQFGRNPKVTCRQNLVPLKPEVDNADSLIFTSTLEVIKVKGVLCEKAELNWLQCRLYITRGGCLFLCLLQV